MIAPSYWVDPKSGNDYMLTVQYPENYVKNLADLGAIPLRAPGLREPTQLSSVARIRHIEAPTEVDHYQLRRVVDVYVAPSGEDLGAVLHGVNGILERMPLPGGVRVNLRGSVQGMQASFSSFGFGLILSVALVYLILVAQFRSFIDPLLILLAVPTGLAGVLITLYLTGTTLNVMSLMGVVMMVGIVVSNSILIVELTQRLREEGKALREAVALACRVRLRPVLMTSLATLIGLIPMAAKLGTGSEAYAPLARAIIGGLAVSVVLTVFIVPAAFLLVYRKRENSSVAAQPSAPGAA
jgi:multidrug efflux pump subunit AcrB